MSREQMPGKRRVSARLGWVGEKGDFFSILLGGEFDKPEGIEVLVEPFAVHQFGMGAAFHEAPLVEHEYTISSLDSRQPVSDYKRRSPFHELLQCLLHESFRLTVESRGGFIQQ
jgi:hypothetical protein